ncbi:MAG TPA: SPFH domain-containing protein [Vicinamibacterales bacterium]|jgi:regulator of protease activity HflC (stomatin/prohibitin superfamily)|nr:SPFH domain-containing protein [Vicinamibacterales bacterium]
MLALKYVLLVGALSMFIAAAAVLVIDARKVMLQADTSSIRWRLFTRYVLIAVLLLLPGLSIVVVPSGMAGVRVSQLSGTVGSTIYPGTHLVVPLIQHMETYNVRDQIYSTNSAVAPKDKTPTLKVYSKEGLPLGLGISVRYQLDPRRLPYMESSLPRPIESELLPTVVANAFRQTISGYMVRDVFSSRREEVRRAAADTISRRLASDGIVVKEVMLRDVDLPQEYAKGLEGLLVKAQENDRLSIEVEMKQKMVRAAELEAEADKVRQLKQSEARAQSTVLEAKAQADAMQYTLPLKEKQIQQSRLEAEARKEATVKGAEAAAQAKVIDSKAELEKRNLMSEADAQRVRLLAVADAARMKSEAEVLKDNPLLIQKIIAERLSDKVQIMMVPMDGKNFFANDVLKAATGGGGISMMSPNSR